MSVNVAKLIAQSFAKFGAPVGVQDCILTKVTPWIRTPGAASSGTNPTTTDHKATGLITEFSAYSLANSLIKAGDRKVLLFGASIQGGVEPGTDDRITIDSETYTIIGPVARDPAKATFICQCRK